LYHIIPRACKFGVGLQRFKVAYACGCGYNADGLEATMNLLEEMSWEEVKEYLEKDDRVILPLGTTEQHGRHLGLGTDFIEAEAIARGAGERTQVAVAPALAYGMSHPQLAFPGTFSLRPTTLIAVLEDLFRSLVRHGFRRVLVVNGHGGNTAALASALHLVSDDLPLTAKTFEWWTDAEAYRVVTDRLGPQIGSHASPGETSFMLAVRPAAVKLNRLTGRDTPAYAGRDFVTMRNFAIKYPDGIIGLDPHGANRDAGEALLRKSIEICARELDEWN
jgi:creatinine amidohydrolase